jgi:hypothetical protein
MRSQRAITFLGVLLAAFVVAMPASALASSLLSGYGGPGQGNQAILGSAVIGGGSNGRGGGSSGGGGGSSTPSGESSSAGSLASSSSSSQSSSSSDSSSASTHHGPTRSTAHPSGHSGHASPSNSGGNSAAVQGAPLTQALYPAAERIPAGAGSSALGLSGSDLLYILLAFIVLAFIGAVTVRFGRSDARSSHRS